MALPRNPRPHILLPDTVTTAIPYRAAPGRSPAIPEQPREAHAQRLRSDLGSVALELEQIKNEQSQAGWTEGFGITIRFTSFPDVQLAIESLEQKREGIELLSVRQEGNELVAQVWMPEGGLALFERKITEYLAEKKDKDNKPRDNRKLLDAIRNIRAAVLEDLWTDSHLLPPENEEACFEAWISTPRDKPARRGTIPRPDSAETRIGRFRQVAEATGLRVGQKELRFPERTVLHVRGTLNQLRSSAHLLGQLAELRRAPVSATFFMGLEPHEQREWAEELLGRTEFINSGGHTPYVCILDTGCMQAHPLLAPALDPTDLFTINPDWTVADLHGHGTEQAGLALWGDLSEPLAQQGPVYVWHRLESVKLVPHDNANQDEHYGSLTIQAVSLPEISNPERRRLFSMAITSTQTTMAGRPTAWSAEIDALTSDWAGDGEAPRLMLICAGNVLDPTPASYPTLNELTPIEDPAQAWNAMTIGAINSKVTISEAGAQHYLPIADAGGLGPHSATSANWQPDTPLKPEVVFEGGNLAHDNGFVSAFDSLSLLTTSNRPTQRLFSTSYATSAATAVASRFAAQIMAHYPDFWPETVRALMIHSARWTPVLLTQFPGNSKTEVEARLRRCGWGEPDLDIALHSGADSLNLLVQGRLQPFKREAGGSATTRDMHLHKLPWPVNALQSLFDQDVELRVSLSYFVEPNPGERGRHNRFSYASHGLRFAVQKPAETIAAFQSRVNRLASDKEEGVEAVSGGDTNWMLGVQKRTRGSFHHDRLMERAADLAGRDHIAVFPTAGWWKTREAQGRFDREARYALVVSIHAPNLPVSIDLYSEITQAIHHITANLVDIAT